MTDESPSADATPRAWDWARAALPYLAVAAIALLIACFVLRVNRAPLTVPYADDHDALLTLQQTKGLVEHGSWFTDPDVAAPQGLLRADVPAEGGLVWVLVRAVSLAFRDHAATLNVYFLLTFALTAAAALYALRRLGAGVLTSSVAAVLYSLLPYHFYRGEWHLMLASYFMVPLMVLVMMWLFEPRVPFFGEELDRRGPLWTDRRGWAAAAIAFLLASTSVYYAFFAGMLVVVAGVLAWVRRADARRLTAAVMIVAVLAIGVVVNSAPTFIEWARHGRRTAAVDRKTAAAEAYSLRISQLVLPILDHRIPAVRAWRRAYWRESLDMSWVLENEKSNAALGIVGTVGFLALLGWPLVYWAWRARPKARPPGGESVWPQLASLSLAAVLIGTMGGFGPLFALLVSPQIRAYNRISVFIAFFAFAAVALLLDRALKGRAPWVALLACAAVLAVGAADQTSREYVPDYKGITRRQEAMADFVGVAERRLPAGAMVFQLPSISFCQAGSEWAMPGSFEHFRPYLASTRLKWSHGAMLDTAQDRWQKATERLAPDAMVGELAEQGFAAVYIDRRAYRDHADALLAGLESATGAAPILSENGNYALVPLPARR